MESPSKSLVANDGTVTLVDVPAVPEVSKAPAVVEAVVPVVEAAGVVPVSAQNPSSTTEPDTPSVVASDPRDPSEGVDREWTNAERNVRWPSIDYTKGDKFAKPEFASIYGPHNALRSDLKKLNAALAALDVADDTRIGNLVWWYATFETITHSHHDIEEHIIIPFFREHGAVLPPKIASDHKALITGLTRIHLELEALQAAPKADRAPLLASLAAYAISFTSMFQEHLREEEDTVIPAEVSIITKALEKELIGRIVKSINLKLTPLEFGWVVHASTPLSIKMFLANVPPPLKWHLPKWGRYFEWRDLHVKSIFDPQNCPLPQIVPRPKGGFCCC